MEMDAQGSPPLISIQNSEKGNNKRSYSVLEEGSEDTSAPSVSATSLPSAHAPSSARSSHLGPENPKAQKLEGKTNNYTNQDQAPYLVHVYALNNSNNNNNNGHLHPMRMFAQVGRIMPAADIIEMRKLGLGQSLPSHVILFWARHAVRPYIPKARFCTKCYRVGHSNVICRSPARCLRCGGPVHAEDLICPEESSTPKCINCSGTSWGAHPDTLLTIYRSVFRGAIEYGCLVFRIYGNKSSFLKVERQQWCAIRIALGYRISTPINVMLAEAKE